MDEKAADAIEVSGASDPTNGQGTPAVVVAPPPLPPVEPMRTSSLPRGLMHRIDYILQNPDRIGAALRDDEDLWSLSRLFFYISCVASGAYGVIMGASNWLQGSSFAFGSEFLMMLVTGLKVPVLFLLTLLIVVFPIHVSSRFIGVRASFAQVVALLLASLAMTTVVLASMGSVAFFFALTTRSYSFIKLLHVVIFAYAGVMGLACLVRWFHGVMGPVSSRGRRYILLSWLLLYMFVGTQLAWVLRPFVGAPGTDYTFFRPRTGNFYENVYESFLDLMDE